MLTVGIQAVLDSYVCLLELVAGLIWDSWRNAFAFAAFAKLVLFFVLEMRLLLVLWNNRNPEGTCSCPAARVPLRVFAGARCVWAVRVLMHCAPLLTWG